jgi:hypothetical protein
VLDVFVDGQLDRRAHRGGSLHPRAVRVPSRIGFDQNRARPPTNLGVVGRLEPVQSGVVDSDVADQMGRQFFVRIEAAALFHEPDAVQAESGDPPRLRGGDLTADVCKGTLAAQPFHQ